MYGKSGRFCLVLCGLLGYEACSQQISLCSYQCQGNGATYIDQRCYELDPSTGLCPAGPAFLGCQFWGSQLGHLMSMQQCQQYDCGGGAQPYPGNPNACNKGSRPVISDYLGIDDLRAPIDSTAARVHVKNVTWKHPHGSHKYVRLSYEAELAEGLHVVNLDHEREVVFLHCRHQAGTLRIRTSSAQSAAALAERFTGPTNGTTSSLAHIITGGREWGCWAPDSQAPQAVFRRVLEVTDISAREDFGEIFLRTSSITHMEVFKQARVSLSVSSFPKAVVHHHHQPGDLKVTPSSEQLDATEGQRSLSSAASAADCNCNAATADPMSITSMACALTCSGKMDISDLCMGQCGGNPTSPGGIQLCARYLSGSLCHSVRTFILYTDKTAGVECDAISNPCFCSFTPGMPVYPNYCWADVAEKVLPLKGFWDAVGGFISSVWHAVQEVASAVEQAAEAASTVVKAIATGDFNMQNVEDLAGLSWNYNSASGGATVAALDLGSGFTCDECFFNLDASLNYDIEIADYKLNKLAVWLQGNLDINLHATLESRSFSVANSSVIATVTPPELTFTVAGIPMVIDTTIPIEVGYNATATENGQVSAQVSMKGTIKKGMLYSNADGQLHWIDEKELKPSGALTGPNQATAAFQLYIFPKVSLLCDHIGGPTVGLKGFLELTADYQPQHTETCPTGEDDGGLFAQLNTGFQAALGAKVDLNLADILKWKKDWPTLLSFTMKWPLLSGCHSASGKQVPSLLGEGSQPVSAAVAYSGLMQADESRPGCANSPSVPISLQVTSAINPHSLKHQKTLLKMISGQQLSNESATETMFELAGAQSGLYSLKLPSSGSNQLATTYNPSSVLQLPYFLGNGQLIAEATPDSCYKAPSSAYCYVYVADQSPEGLGLPNFNFAAQLSQDMATISLTDTTPGSCYPPATMSRFSVSSAASSTGGHLWI